MTEEEKKLIEGCIAGNPIAQKQLYLQYGPMIKGVCTRYTTSKENGEDLFHDVFVFILINFNKYTRISSLEGWLRRIAINKAIDSYRTDKRHPIDYLNDADMNIADSEAFEDVDTIPMNTLVQFINELPDKHRMAINLCLIDEVDQREAAAMMDESETNLRTMLCRAKQTLRKRIDKYLKDREK